MSRQAPTVFAPAALAFLPAIPDDRVPVAVSLFLIFSRYLKKESLALLEHRAAIEAKTGYASDGELNSHDIALFPAWAVAWSVVNCPNHAGGKGPGVELRKGLRVPVVPETNRVFCDGWFARFLRQCLWRGLRVLGDGFYSWFGHGHSLFKSVVEIVVCCKITSLHLHDDWEGVKSTNLGRGVANKTSLHLSKLSDIEREGLCGTVQKQRFTAKVSVG